MEPGTGEPAARGFGLFKKDGLFYARLPPVSAEPLEVALHGIACEEQARAAAEALAGPRGDAGAASP